MADNDQVLQELKAINKRLDEQGQVITQVKTGVEALAAGQREDAIAKVVSRRVVKLGSRERR